MFGLVDGNSFYCSCERAFDPTLRGKPLVVLSNNDGCIIARTQEAKDLGLKMGEPWHIASKRPGVDAVVWMSSNYALYGDMSRRMYELLVELAPAVEPYSIDEMFLDLAGVSDPMSIAREIRVSVRRIAKIPTCVGIGPTKTIAKLANKMAKSYRTGTGICDFSTPDAREKAYPAIDISDIWGVGPASVAKLRSQGVNTVADFVALPQEEVRGLMTVVGARMPSSRVSAASPLRRLPQRERALRSRVVSAALSRPGKRWSKRLRLMLPAPERSSDVMACRRMQCRCSCARTNSIRIRSTQTRQPLA